MRTRILGMVFIAVSIAFLLASFYTESILFLNFNVPSAGISIISVVFAVAFLEYADKSEIKAQKKVISEVSDEMDELTSALASDLKREDKIKADLKREIGSLTSDMKKQDKTLASGLKMQEKTLSSRMKKQGKVNVEIKKRIRDISSDVKKMGKPAGKKEK